MLPFKKPQWQELSMMDNGKDSTLKSAMLGNSTKERRMRMIYEYATVTQIFSINRFPSRWCYPINLLMMHHS